MLHHDAYNIPNILQVFAACLDTGNEALANDCLAALLDQFKDSARVKRLVGMQQEAERSFSAASETYDDMLASNPANALAMKRRVAVLKGRGDNKEAVKELNRYLDQFQGDATAWQELADLYLDMSKYDAAAFCFEELVLHDPMNHLMVLIPPHTKAPCFVPYALPLFLF